MSIVGISGNATRPSKTHTLVSAVVDGLAATAGVDATCFDLAGILPTLAGTLRRSDASGSLLAVYEAIEGCNHLVVGSPTYKAYYTGLLKHLFDLMDMGSLRGRRVTLCATGRAPSHGPLVEGGLRALFDVFDAEASPGFVYALDEDFTSDGRMGDDLRGRVDALVGRGLR